MPAGADIMEKNVDPSDDFSSTPPAGWSLDEFRTNWSAFLDTIVKENGSLVPARRVRFQIEQAPAFQQIVAGWEKMDGRQRLEAWKQLLLLAENTSGEILPTCVECGECCRRSSPTLQLEDLEILQSGQIPWDRLYALRKGEPARSPFDGRPFILPEERIKIREKEGTQECVFLDDSSERCTIYSDRPLQCRAQACWDPAPAKDLAEQPFLLREHVFGHVEVLMSIIAEHDTRCSFQSLAEALEKLRDGDEDSIANALRVLSYEEHFREFVGEEFNIPGDNMELVFGRSFSKMAALFGYKVVEGPDGSRCLMPDSDPD
jgi:Fe-S-cluster containining protein